MNAHKNISMRDALRLARDLGCSTRPIPATDEVRITHPDWPTPLTMKSIRHDAGAKFAGRLRQLEKRQVSP